MRLCYIHSRYTKIFALPTGTGASVFVHLPDDHWVQVRKESTTINLGLVANKHEGVERSQEDDRSGQRD